MADWIRALAETVDERLKAAEKFGRRPEVQKAVGDIINRSIEGAGKVAQGGIELAKKYDSSPAPKRDEQPRPIEPSATTSRTPDQVPERAGKQEPVVASLPATDWPKIGAGNKSYQPVDRATHAQTGARWAQANGETVRVREEKIAKPNPFAEGALITELPSSRANQDVHPDEPMPSPGELEQKEQSEYERELEKEVQEIQQQTLNDEREKQEMADLLKQLKDTEQRLTELMAEQAQFEAEEKARRAKAAAAPQKETKPAQKKPLRPEKKAAPVPAPAPAPHARVAPEKIQKEVEATKRQVEDLKKKEQTQKAHVAHQEAAKAKRIPEPAAPRVTTPVEPLLLKQSDRVAINIVKNLLAYEGVPKPLPDKHFVQRQLNDLEKKLKLKKINSEEFKAHKTRIFAEEAQSKIAAERRRGKSPEQLRSEWAQTIVTAAKQAKVDPLLVLAVMKKESSFREWAVSLTNARGLLQLLRAAVQDVNKKYPDLVSLDDVRDEPTANLKTGIRYLAFQNERFQHDLEFQLLAYNVGPTRVQAVLNARGIGLGNEAAFKKAPKGKLTPLREASEESLQKLLLAPKNKDLRESKFEYANKIAKDWVTYAWFAQDSLKQLPKS